MGNTCEVTDEKIDEVSEKFTEIADFLASGELKVVPEFTVKALVNQLESVQKTTSDKNVVQNEESIAKAQENFEKIMVKTKPNVAIVSDNGLVAIKTVNETVQINPISNSTEPTYVYQSDLEAATGVEVAVPKSIFGDDFQPSDDCPTPVAFAEQLAQNHLQPDSEDVKNAGISLVVTTCDALQNKKFAKPVEMAFGAAFALGRTESQMNETNNAVPVAECSYYDPELYLWRYEGPARYNPEDGKYYCKATHLTYFSMLFKDGTQDNNALTILDNVLTILSLVCSFSLISWKCFMSEQAVWIRLGLRPMERSYLQLAIALFCTNITFLIGADMRTPAYEQELPKASTY